ncbi:hypothetical protein B0H14DRAFT_3703108 [Mycena olivaceomarginata]|nr:hypothetical protein B0H14DRAFT_3703108 [Mycena olivaceomarginata]
MPELRPDENDHENASTAIWTGKDPPTHPLAYTYRDPTIIDRALHGLWLYLDANGYLDKALPDSAIFLWAKLKVNYKSTYERESWFRPVEGALRFLLEDLVNDLHLGFEVVFSAPSRKFSQEGDADWVVLQDVPSNELRNIMITEAGQSDVHALVPSCADTNCRLVPFLALLIAINAPPGMLTFADPDPALALAGYENYLAVLSGSPLPTSSSKESASLLSRFRIPDNCTISAVLTTSATPYETLCLIPANDSSIWTTCYGPPGTLNHETPVVAKLYDVGSGFEALLRELDAYECMEGLECVPRCLGVYAPVMNWKDFDFNPEERWAIYEAVEKIHAAGVVHGDLETRNIVRDEDGDFYIIDFGHSLVDHQCEPQTPWCSELRSLWDDLDLDDS